MITAPTHTCVRPGFKARCWALAEFFSIGTVHWCRHERRGNGRDVEYILVRVEGLDEASGHVLVRQVDGSLVWWPYSQIYRSGHLEAPEREANEAFHRWGIAIDVEWDRRRCFERAVRMGGYAALEAA